MRPSKVHSQKLIAQLQSREQVRRLVASLAEPEAEIEHMYKQVLAHCKATLNSAALDEKQRRSQAIDEQMNELRSANALELQRLHRVTAQLLVELHQMEAGSYIGDAADSTTSVDHEGTSKVTLITKQIMMQLGLRTFERAAQSRDGERRRRALEAQVNNKFAVILARLGLPLPGERRSSSSSSSSSNTGHSPGISRDEASAGKGKVAPEEALEDGGLVLAAAAANLSLQAVAGRAQLPVSSEPASEPQLAVTHKPASEPQLVATHKRVFDNDHKRHFYVCQVSGTSSWTPPSAGVIACEDESGDLFFVDTTTRRTAWAISDLGTITK